MYLARNEAMNPIFGMLVAACLGLSISLFLGMISSPFGEMPRLYFMATAFFLVSLAALWAFFEGVRLAFFLEKEKPEFEFWVSTLFFSGEVIPLLLYLSNPFWGLSALMFALISLLFSRASRQHWSA